MDRLILIAPTETPLARMNAAASWLESEGGGTIVAETIADLDDRDGMENLLVLGWHPSDYSEWMERVQPQRMVLRK